MIPSFKGTLLLTIASTFAISCGDQLPDTLNESSTASSFLSAEDGAVDASTLCGETHLSIDLGNGVKCLGNSSSLSDDTKTVRVEGEFGEREIGYEVVDGLAVSEGDVLLGKAEDVEDAIAMFGGMKTGAIWPNGVVPYRISPYLANQNRVRQAIAHWEQKTGLRFVVRTNQRDYVVFNPGSGCSSYIGRIGGAQSINLGSSCAVGNVIHEIGHAVGFWHEQARTDRDKHVRILWGNISSGLSSQFSTFSTRGNANVGSYDIGSIMHYGSYFFSRNGRPTMTKLNGGIIYAQRQGLSAGDIDSVKRIYGK